jgi:hypothetical protein
MKKLLAVLLLISSTASVALLTTGCGQAAAASAGSPFGREVTIQFRRDALGTAAPLPVSPTTGRINGAEVAVSGRLMKFTEEWIVISQGENRELWINRSTVLLMEFPLKSR